MKRLSVIVFGLSTLFFAISGRPVEAAGPVELDAAYQWQQLSCSGCETVKMPAGFDIDLAAGLTQNLSVVAQFDWSRKSESMTAFGTTATSTIKLSTYGGGIRWSARTPAATPFVQFLAGGSHGSGGLEVGGESVFGGSGSDPMIQIGGGVAAPFNGKLGVVAQVDYRRFFESSGDLNDIRVLGGVRLTLSK